MALAGSVMLLSLSAAFSVSAEPLSLGAFYLWQDKPYPSFRTGAKSEVLPYISYDDDRFFWQGLDGGVRLLAQSDVVLSLIGRYNTMGYEMDDSPTLAGMADRDPQFELGGAAHWKPGNLGLLLYGLADVTGTSDGWESGLTVTLTGETRSWKARYALGAFYQSEDMVDYYFGVTPAEEVLPTRPTYLPDAEFTGIFVIDLTYSFQAPVELWTRMEFRLFGSEIEDSPIVSSDFQYTGMIGLGYRFDFWDD